MRVASFAGLRDPGQGAVRPVSPAEADRLNKDDEFWRRIELLCAIGEENGEFYAIRGDLIDYVERIQYLARPSVGSTKRFH
ncbi:MAG: hypothetical protein O7I42_08380 [Alphaproteobacteria bacterium]|nr:hypothetical protein [Alphaproteobacteria bacterium]